MRTGTTASWTSVRENPSGVFFKRSDISRSVTYKHTENNDRHIWNSCDYTFGCPGGFVNTTMQQSVEQRWSKLQGEVSSSTLYWSIQGSLSRTSFSTFQSVSYMRGTHLLYPWCLYIQEKAHNSHANLVLCCNIFSVFMCIPFWGTAVGHWRQVHRAERLNVLSPMKREQVGEQGCQQGEMLNLQVSFHSLASLAPWK